MINGDGSLLGGRLAAARDRAFTGRAAELELFRTALAGGPHAPAVLFLHGPGGIGKSMLLSRYAKEARDAGRTVIEVDGRTMSATPDGFEEAVRQGPAVPEAAGTPGAPREPRTAACAGAVLLVDTFERCRRLEGWLRDRFLPRLPLGSLVVIAGREAPDPAWSADPGWADLLRVVALDNLRGEDSLAYLRARDVPAHLHDALLGFTGGHPLALSLATAVTLDNEAAPADWSAEPRHPGAASTWSPSRNVIETLLARLVGEVPTPLHRRALEICAHAYCTSEELLRALLGEDAGPMFAWLRGLPFVDSTGLGLFPHDVVRESLQTDLRWRDPEGYAEMHRQLRDHLFDKVKAAPDHAILRSVGMLLSLYRAERHPSGTHTWCVAGMLRDCPYQTDDHGQVLQMTKEAEGPESAELARYWLERQPGAFRVYRSVDTGETVAFSAWLRFTQPPGEDVDPAVTAAWAHARKAGPLRAGEFLSVARFQVCPADHRHTSPPVDHMHWRNLGEIFRADRLAWSFSVTRAAPDHQAEQPGLFALEPLEDTVDIGGHAYALCAHDWRVQPVTSWLETRTRLALSGGRWPQSATGGGATGPGPSDGLLVLERSAFDTAVRDALRALRDSRVLGASPLVRTRLVAGRREGLREVLTGAIEALREERGGEKYHRAVTTTYLGGAPTQEKAAERLGLPFSTYRRHLSGGVERICEALWERELHGFAPR
ncbi:AAA family ATPase [Streptomyces sp. A012304]|uniref:AAA family ATPase n=1 Tax=Streptomyces sp. A012304 TaxID=375446 RepID=UPI00222FECC5|nr:ATP-binding protein [Streptomyces sp. A012304]GKQ40223.1 hypothetical protein ALMP_67490 [Streptomyces sp. A012304]